MPGRLSEHGRDSPHGNVGRAGGRRGDAPHRARTARGRRILGSEPVRQFTHPDVDVRVIRAESWQLFSILASIHGGHPAGNGSIGSGRIPERIRLPLGAGDRPAPARACSIDRQIGDRKWSGSRDLARAALTANSRSCGQPCDTHSTSARWRWRTWRASRPVRRLSGWRVDAGVLSFEHDRNSTQPSLPSRVRNVRFPEPDGKCPRTVTHTALPLSECTNNR